MSQAQLAREVSKTEMWVSLRLRGKQPIDVNDMHLIAKALDVGVHQLLPPPEVAAGAADGEAIPRYSQEDEQPGHHTPRPRDNRPPGHPAGVRVLAGGRTAYVPRGPAGRRD